MPTAFVNINATDARERFIEQLTTNQNRLYGYVYSLLGDGSRAADVLQETNLVLWRKVDEFDPGKPFLPWAFATARFQVLAHVRDRQRDRLLLDAELVESLSVEAEQQAERFDHVREALRKCLPALSTENRELLELRYDRAMSIAEVAGRVNRTCGAIKVALMRSRRRLAECVQNRLAAEH